MSPQACSTCSFFYDSFPPSRNPAYPYFTKDLNDLETLMEQRGDCCELPGLLQRPYLLLVSSACLTFDPSAI